MYFDLTVFLHNLILSTLCFWLVYKFSNNIINRKRYTHCKIRDSIWNEIPNMIITGFMVCVGVYFLLKSVGYVC